MLLGEEEKVYNSTFYHYKLVLCGSLHCTPSWQHGFNSLRREWYGAVITACINRSTSNTTDLWASAPRLSPLYLIDNVTSYKTLNQVKFEKP
jgi:hypothetical protein